MTKNALSFGFILLLSSCALFRFSGRDLARISPGMGKIDVIKKLGKPQSVGGHDNVQILHYQEHLGGWQWNYYYVRLVDDKVESYGPEVKGNPMIR